MYWTPTTDVKGLSWVSVGNPSLQTLSLVPQLLRANPLSRDQASNGSRTLTLELDAFDEPVEEEDDQEAGQ